MTKAELLLIQIAEEAAEVAQAASKCLRFGVNDVYPAESKETNLQKLHRELIELQTVHARWTKETQGVAALSEKDRKLTTEIVQHKLHKINLYMDYSKKVGVLKEPAPALCPASLMRAIETCSYGHHGCEGCRGVLNVCDKITDRTCALRKCLYEMGDTRAWEVES